MYILVIGSIVNLFVNKKYKKNDGITINGGRAETLCKQIPPGLNILLLPNLKELTN
jgi:hypothetical protein